MSTQTCVTLYLHLRFSDSQVSEVGRCIAEDIYVEIVGLEFGNVDIGIALNVEEDAVAREWLVYDDGRIARLCEFPQAG